MKYQLWYYVMQATRRPAAAQVRVLIKFHDFKSVNGYFEIYCE